MTATAGTVRAELGKLLPLAMPIILAQLSQMALGVADTIMAGRVSAADLAGVAIGGNLYFPLFMLISGVVLAVNPTVSQLHGGGRTGEAGEVARQALWIAIFGGLVLVAVLLFAESIYAALGVDARAIPIASGYLRGVAFGVLPALGYFALRYLCEGLSWTLPAMLIAVGALFVKIPLNSLFIYGGFGVPAMGGVGCGWATAAVSFFQLACMLLVIRHPRVRATGLLARVSAPSWPAIRKLVLLGLPIGTIAFLEISLFSGTTLMIGRIGVDAVAAHQVAMNVGGLAFMVPLALGTAASIRVGTNIGAGKLAAARHSGRVAVGASLAFATIMALVIFASRNPVAALYSKDPAVIALAAQLMLFAAGFQFFDASQATIIGALRGYKDTRGPMLISILAYWGTGFLPAAALGMGWFGLPAMGVYGFWSGLTLGLAVASLAFFARFRWLGRNPAHIAALAAG
jgi:MATE family multidrug resistance protein